jgi:guanylate kinase
LLRSTPRLEVSVSHTTRPSRLGEQDGVDYHFVDQASFDALRAAGTFLEYAEVFGHHYGTSRAWVLQRLQAGVDIVLEIDWQGARQICRALPDTVSVFILPPSRAALEQRLRARAQDSAEVIARRMRDAVHEIAHYAEFDYLVLNDDFDAALADLQAILRARRLYRDIQAAELKDLLTDLLA